MNRKTLRKRRDKGKLFDKHRYVSAARHLFALSFWSYCNQKKYMIEYRAEIERERERERGWWESWGHGDISYVRRG